MTEPATKNLGRKIALGVTGVVIGYILLILVFPRVLDGYQYHALNDRLGVIERSNAVLLDRTEARPMGPTGTGPVEASLASNGGPYEDRALAERLDRVTVALERLEAALEAQTRAIEALVPQLESLVAERRVGDDQ